MTAGRQGAGHERGQSGARDRAATQRLRAIIERHRAGRRISVCVRHNIGQLQRLSDRHRRDSAQG